MDGENNGKPYQNGWFGGISIFGNTHFKMRALLELWAVCSYRRQQTECFASSGHVYFEDSTSKTPANLTNQSKNQRFTNIIYNRHIFYDSI